jgi:hypothetical protein
MKTIKTQNISIVLLSSLLTIGTISAASQPTLVSAATQTAAQATATLLATQSATAQADKSGPQDKGTVSIGSTLISQQASPTTSCSNSRTRFVEGRLGVVTAVDGSKWTVPAPITDSTSATDLYNDCTGAGDNSRNYPAQLKTVVIDPDGVDITAFIFADNYFELFINGTFVARDAITFVPFNSAVVRFKVKYPYTVAVKLVDWETHLGIGTEYDNYHIGDGGFIAKFSDGTVTNSKWKVEPFYIAPLDNPNCVDVANGRNSSKCTLKPTCITNNPDKTCQALHFYLPNQWTAPTYDASWWNPATLYKAQDVTNQPAYVQYTSYFQGADFIWSHSLILDDLVLARYTVEKPATK